MTSMQVNTGIAEKERHEIADGLSRLLADSYTLYVKTHNFHWNVTGPMFSALHTMFEQQYTELQTAVDDIAERIRALGFPAPGSFADFTRLASVKDSTGSPNAQAMIRELVEGHETIARTCRKVFPAVDRASDEASADLLTARMQHHEKTAWMLRSLLEQ
jgi:starvation-inducible DNA-binding protein